MNVAAVARDVAANPLWYHTIDLAPGVTTPGWFDTRSVVDRVGLPDVAGKRCLDVGTYDGFFAFELERRGAREVVATDIASHEDWDWPVRARARGVEYLRSVAGEKGRGFEIAARALDSAVERHFVSVYDLSPERLGTFDVVVCGAVLLHLRDPFRGLAALRSVCTDLFLSIEAVDLWAAVPRGRPRFVLTGIDGQWLTPSPGAHVRMLEISGFDVLRNSGPFGIPYGTAHPRPALPVGARVRSWAERVRLRGAGVPHQAVLTRRATFEDDRG